ncbi:MAG: M43 family zinc metalloprotease, partial [Chitinophagaceae bacterium]
MRNFTLPLVASLLLSLLALNVTAQKTLPTQQAPGNTVRERCGSMEALERWFDQNPAAKQQYLKNVEEGNRMAASARESGSNESHRLQAIVTIPVVVHLVLPAARQAQVTKADVIWQINKMNEDFAGVNADSTNAPNFYGIRGHTQIRFCLAQQDANGNPTDGINRVYSTITDFSPTTVGSIKHGTSCGADAWDPNRYFNIWVGQSTSLLGIATFPQTGAADEQGIALAVDGFSNNPVYVNPAFNKGRTAVHEAGHFFGLYHIWGDDGTGCGTDDFRQVPGTCLLPAALLLGDTPNQAGATGGCPSGVRTDLCSAASPGINYQNYMDYTDDACYSMFTTKQAERAEYILTNCRASLMTSNGCTPVTVFANDASPKLLSPGNSCFPGGIGSTFCQNTTFNGQVMLFNVGSSNLTSVTIYAQVGTGTPQATNWTGNLAPYASTIVTLNNISAGAVAGTLPLKIYTSNPNAVADQRPSNDTATVNITVTAAGTGVPSVTEGFESATFPPTGWSLINPNAGSITWTRTTTARNSGTASAYINYYNYTTTGHLDYLVSPIVGITDADSVIVNFARAYKRYGTGTTFSDTMLIQLSTSCGSVTFPITAWKKGGSDLSTSPGTNTGNWFPIATDWATERLELKPFIPVGATSVQVAFTGQNGFGQNLFLDDINIRTVVLVRRDAQLRAITNPVSKLCSGTVTPSVELFNSGKDTLKSVKIAYRIIGPSFNLLDSI